MNRSRALDRESHASKLRERRAELARARAALAARRRKVRAACKRYRRLARARVRAWYREAIERLRAERRQRLGAIREKCAARLRSLAELATVARAERDLAAYRQIRANLVAVRGGARAEASAIRRAHRQTTRERQAEDDDQVRGNIEAIDRALLPVWEKMRRAIKASPRKSRTEAFLQWCEENPGEVIAIQAEAGEAGARRLVRELAEQERAHREADHAAKVAALRVRYRKARGRAPDRIEVLRGARVIAVYPAGRGASALREPAAGNLRKLARAARDRWLAEGDEVPF